MEYKHVQQQQQTNHEEQQQQNNVNIINVCVQVWFEAHEREDKEPVFT